MAKLRLGVSGAVVLVGAVCLPIAAANADTYNWNFSGSSFSGSGTLTVNSADLITRITGTFHSATITGLSFAADDILFPNGNSPTGKLLDVSGVAFLTGSTVVNIFGAPAGYGVTVGTGPSSFGSFTATPIPSAPGPIAGAGLPGLIFAGAIFAAAGLLGWWRRKRNAVNGNGNCSASAATKQ